MGQSAQLPGHSFRPSSLVIRLFAACAASALAGCGAATLLSTPTPIAASKGPQLGYLWLSKDATLRPILGMAGASQLGQSVVPAGSYLSAATTAKGTLALMQAVDGTLDLVTLPAGNATALAASIPAGAILNLSPGGGTGIAYLPTGSSAIVLTALLSTPQSHTISAGGTIVDAAVSDTGSVAFEVLQGTTLSATVVGADGKSRTVASLGGPGGLAFVPGTDTLLLADSASNTLSLIASASSTPSPSTVATAALLQAPVALGVSTSGHWALVANGSGNGVVSIDLVHNTSLAVTCVCSPSAAAPLADDGTFRITAAPTGPNWVVDATKAAPRVLFIPPLAMLLPLLALAAGASL